MSNWSKESKEDWDVTNAAKLSTAFTQPKTFIGKIEDWNLTNVDPELTQFAEITWDFILPVVMQGLLKLSGITEQNIKVELSEGLKHVDKPELSHRRNALWLKAQINVYHLKSGYTHSVIKKALFDFTETL